MLNETKGTVLILSTYPVIEPTHGGQLRLLNIQRAYEAAGWKTSSLAVYSEETYRKEQVGPIDILFPTTSRYRLFKGRDLHFASDLLSGTFAVAEDGGWFEVLKNIPIKIDVIHVEQPWLWPLAVKIKGLREYASVALVYGSQNIEEPLKRGIFDTYDVDDAEDFLNQVDSLERRAAKEADLTIAVTQEEADVFASWGVRDVLLAPNGIEPWHADVDVVAEWRRKLPEDPWLLYIASAHPPNFTNFVDVFGGSLGCFSPLNRLVVAGGVAQHIYLALQHSRWSSLNLSRLHLLSKLSDRDLAAVKSLAHGFVLPIPFGGGSNIKTAEAIYSGSYVIGTKAAFRGFEGFLSLPEIRSADNPESFHRQIREMLSSPRRSAPLPGTIGFDQRQSVTWARCLAQVPVVVEKAKFDKVLSE